MNDTEERSVPDRSQCIASGVSTQGLRCRLISIVSLILLTGIILIVLFTRESSKDPNLERAALLEKLKPLLTNISRQELYMNGSVPSLAVDWLLYQSNFKAYSFDRQVQRFAMASFYYSTDGESWIENNGWLTDDDECTWYQTTNKDVCVNGSLRVLSLINNSIYGLLPNDFALLSSLEILNLATNRVAGSIPSTLSSLRILALQENDYASFPDGLTHLTKLQVLRLLGNRINGTIPMDIFSKLTMLKTYDVSRSELSGEIPNTIQYLTSLETLNFLNNALNGTIPTEVGMLKNLQNFWIQFNSFSGDIPSEIGQCTELKSLALHGNILDGSIPTEIGHCTELTLLALYGTVLRGSIPIEIGRLTKLEYLDTQYNSLNGNKLGGTLPAEIGALGKLKYLDISSNPLLNRTIPGILCNQGVNIFYDSGSIKCNCCF